MKHYIGKIHLKWCPKCNIPLLGRKCGICGEESLNVKITPPGDVRIGFRYDIEFLNDVLKKEYGINDKTESFILLNKLTGFEEGYEIISDGEVKYILYYNEKLKDWKIKLKTFGAYTLYNKGANKKIIKIDENLSKIIKKGMTILKPGIVEYKEFKKDDDVIILNYKNEVIGVGKALVSSEDIENLDKGKIIKVREIRKINNNDFKKYSFDEAINLTIKANEEVIKKYEQNAIGFIKNTVEKINRPVIVAYSGGKDSLTTLILVKKALSNFDVLFIDTGLELPETLENIKEVEDTYNIKVNVIKSPNFWELVDKYGVPARDYRWCSDILKLNPLKEYLEKNYKDDVLSFVGIRKYESFNRAKKKLVHRNTYIKKQINALPIFHWSALHVWIYLLKENAPYNKLYEKGFDRIGCYICPAMGLGEIERIKKLYPNLWDRWERKLKEFAKKNNLSEDWVKSGWRWKNKK
ncbi:phosphoadenosine phosphosulfate reductase family protein [Methanocaldococcus indicus]|uniref:phosphoadenosine phosphosulfate reductase domain-containing protein n=1 Tax=Methanocaldococcus indicus TaxID=213231 RepID=UPI003C6D0371